MTRVIRVQGTPVVVVEGIGESLVATRSFAAIVPPWEREIAKADSYAKASTKAKEALAALKAAAASYGWSTALQKQAKERVQAALSTWTVPAPVVKTKPPETPSVQPSVSTGPVVTPSSLVVTPASSFASQPAVMTVQSQPSDQAAVTPEIPVEQPSETATQTSAEQASEQGSYWRQLLEGLPTEGEETVEMTEVPQEPKVPEILKAKAVPPGLLNRRRRVFTGLRVFGYGLIGAGLAWGAAVVLARK